MKISLTAALCLLTLFCAAQKNFLPGWVVTNNGDTLRGYIDYQERDRSPVSVTFKKEIREDKTEVFTSEHIRSFEITGHEFHERWLCRISMDTRALNNLSIGMDTAHRTGSVFLMVLASGKNVTLYSYEDHLKTRFYVKGLTDSIPQELIHTVYLDPDAPEKLREINTWQQQLTVYAFGLSPTLSGFQDIAYRSAYNKKDLLKLTSMLNGEAHAKKNTSSPFRRSRFFAGAGLNRGTFGFKGGYPEATSLQFSPSYSTVFFAGVDVFKNPATRRWLFRQELYYTTYNFRGTYTDTWATFSRIYTYRLKQEAFSANSSVLYHLYNKETFRFFAGAGISASYYKYTENDYRQTAYGIETKSTPYLFAPVALDLQARTGLSFRNKLEISLLHSFPLTRLTNYIYYSDQLISQQLRISYLFSHKRGKPGSL